MSTTDLNVSRYIQNCAKEGVSFPDDIVKRAQTEYSDLEDEIKLLERKVADLRPKKALLQQVFKTFAVDMPTKSVRPVAIIADVTTPEELDETQLDLVVQFCEFLEPFFNDKKDVTAPDVRDGLKIKLENDTIVYSMIKWLGINGFIQRRNGIYLAPGDNWITRPVRSTTVAV